jgi:hypothetical protein
MAIRRSYFHRQIGNPFDAIYAFSNANLFGGRRYSSSTEKS